MKSKEILNQEHRKKIREYFINNPELRNTELDIAVKALLACESELEEKEKHIDKYATSARVIHLWLKDFCDENLPYDEMIAEAARRASKEISGMREAFETKWQEREAEERSFAVIFAEEEKDKEIEILQARIKELEEYEFMYKSLNK